MAIGVRGKAQFAIAGIDATEADRNEAAVQRVHHAICVLVRGEPIRTSSVVIRPLRFDPLATVVCQRVTDA